MSIGDVHQWLGKASCGMGPVFRWVWALLMLISAAFFIYLVTEAIG